MAFNHLKSLATALMTFSAGAPIVNVSMVPNNYVKSPYVQQIQARQEQEKVNRGREQEDKRIQSNKQARLILERQEFSDRSIIGALYLDKDDDGIVDADDERLCYTLELPYRDNQRNISSIPEGSYQITRENHPKFGYCFRLRYVPGRSGVLIHYGNFPKDTRGCPLVGESKGKDAVYKSRSAIKKITDRFNKATLVVKSR